MSERAELAHRTNTRADHGDPIRRTDDCAERAYISGASRNRTGDLLLAKQALSQLSYGPVGPYKRFSSTRLAASAPLRSPPPW